jgi:hypothetical protein
VCAGGHQRHRQDQPLDAHRSLTIESGLGCELTVAGE